MVTIANYQIICCEAVRSAILATAWLLVTVVYSVIRTLGLNRFDVYEKHSFRYT